jgi:subtilisin family serine protease
MASRIKLVDLQNFTRILTTNIAPISIADPANIRFIVPTELKTCHNCPPPSEPLYGFLSPVGTTPDGQLAVENQKILILRKSDVQTITGAVLKAKGDIYAIKIEIIFKKGDKKTKGGLFHRICRLLFPPKPIVGTIIRIGECPNNDKEETVPVLIEWPASNRVTSFAEPGSIVVYNSNLTPISPLDQLYNLVIKDDPAGSPGKPVTGASSVITKVYPSELTKVCEEIKNQYLENEQKKTVVAVLDTGLKFLPQYNDCSTGHYKDRQKHCQSFRVAASRDGRSVCALPQNALGYNAVSDFFKLYQTVITIPSGSFVPYASYPFNIYNDVAFQIHAKSLSLEDIVQTPYDDNRVDQIDEFGCCHENVGRHGTIISAIINQKGASVLPVKTFNAAGYGTFFDLLCSINYVLAKKREGMNISAINASFIGTFTEKSPELNVLSAKFKQIKEAGIWVIAAAGNEDEDLGTNKKYPACFTEENIITVGTATKPYRLVPGTGQLLTPNPNLEDPASRMMILRNLGISPDAWDWKKDSEWISTNNISTQYVHIAVGNAVKETDEFTSPFLEGDKSFTGTSIAAAHVSAVIAANGPFTNNRSAIFNQLNRSLTLTPQTSLLRTVSGGWLMTVS